MAMHPLLRARFIRDVICDLAGLSGPAFETFGYRVVEHIRPAAWQHRGTNLSGAPVGHTVDSKADGGELVGEYSTEADYFEKGLEKLEADISHARGLHANVRELLTFSNQLAGPLATTKVQQVEAREKDAGVSLACFDARRIAEYVVDRLHDESFVGKLEISLPTLRNIRQLWASSHRVPHYEGYVPRPAVEATIAQHIRTNPVTLVTGLSGLGKSAIVSRVAHELRDGFELVIWVDGSEINSVEDLHAIDLDRGGQRSNISGVIRVHDCLLILDNVVRHLNVGEVAAQASPNTRIVVTSQVGAPGALALPPLTRDEASAILKSNVTCAPELLDSIFDAVGGHPLVLSALRSLAEVDDAGWEAVRAMLHSAVGLEDERNQRIFDRILDGHARALDRELRFIGFCGSARIDEVLWNSVFGPDSKLALSKRHFLAAGTVGVLRVHDLVAACVIRRYPEALDAQFAPEIRAFVESHFRAEDSLTLQRAVYLHADMFARLIRGGFGDPAVLYGYALSRSPQVRPDVLGDPVQFASAGTTGGYDLFVAAAIEIVEAHYSTAKATHGRDRAREQLEQHLRTFDLLEDLPLSDVLKRDVSHHRAKALAYLGRADAAASIFADILTRWPEFAESRLQLARTLLRRHDADGAARELLRILEAARGASGENAVATTVLLAAFEDLARAAGDRAAEVVLDHRDLFVACMLGGLRFQYDQPFKVIAALGSTLSYHAPELLVDCLERLPPRLVDPGSDRERFAWAQTQKFAAKALLRAGRDSATAMLVGAAESYRSLAKPESFHLMQQSECLLLLRRFEECVEVLERVAEAERNAFWEQRRAQACLERGDPGAALAHFDRALAHAEREPRHLRFRAAFLHGRFQARARVGDRRAHEDLERAISLCEDDRYRAELESELAAVCRS